MKTKTKEIWGIILIIFFGFLMFYAMVNPVDRNERDMEKTIRFLTETYYNPNVYTTNTTYQGHLYNANKNRVAMSSKTYLYRINEFIKYIYKSYIVENYDVTMSGVNVFTVFCEDTELNNAYAGTFIANEERTPMGILPRDPKFGNLIIIYDQVESRSYESAYEEVLSSLEGDEKKPNDVSIPYKGKLINIDKDLLGDIMHELMHYAEIFDKDFKENEMHYFKKSIDLEEKLSSSLGVPVRYHKNGAQ